MAYDKISHNSDSSLDSTLIFPIFNVIVFEKGKSVFLLGNIINMMMWFTRICSFDRKVGTAIGPLINFT